MATINGISGATGDTSRSSGISSRSLGKDEFLQLLVTKMQNQDPLNPTTDEDFVAQLAQFSTLEQMNNISEGIATSNQWDYLQMQSLNNVMASGLIGKEVTASYGGVQITDGEPANLVLTLDRFASNLTVTIKNEEGDVVATIRDTNVVSGKNSIEWDAKDNRGNRVENGFYTVSVSAQDVNGNQFEPSLNLVGQVESVIYREGTAFLRVSGLEIPLGDITAVSDGTSGE